MRVATLTPVLAVMMIAVLLAGCGGAKGGSGGKLEDVNWVLESYESQGNTRTIPADIGIDALFENGKVSGSSGVNTYTSQYQLSGASLSIGLPATTMMAGPEAALEVEQAYLTSLQQAASFTSSAGTLVIFDKEGRQILSYIEGEAISLTGVQWSVTGYNNGKGGVVTPIMGTELTALFSEDGKVSGSSGVNTFNGQYTFDNLTISIGPLATTGMSSADAARMEQEAAYLAALQSATRLSMKAGNELDLRKEDGALAVSFVTKP
jgi:heat shock protein HslJ